MVRPVITGRVLVLALVFGLAAGSLALLARDDVEYRVDLHSVLEIWGDLLRDAEHLPLTVTRMSVDDEIALGDRLHDAMFGDTELVSERDRRYVAAVGRAVAAHVQRGDVRYRFHVIRDSSVNAHALLGGHVYVTTGMLDFVETEAELAAVIGHEVSHVDLYHCAQKFQYERLAAKIVGDDLAQLVLLGRRLLELGFSEQQEVESDAGGMRLAAAAGYDPGAALDLDQRMAERRAARSAPRERTTTVSGEVGRAVVDALGEYFSTHPTGALRVHALLDEYRKGLAGWSGRKYYAGRNNLRERIVRGAEAPADEWVALRPAHAFEKERPARDDASASGTGGAPEAPVPGSVRQPDAAGPHTGGPRQPVLRWAKLGMVGFLRERPDADAAAVLRVEADDRVFVVARVGSGRWLQVAAPFRDIEEAYLTESVLAERVPHARRFEVHAAMDPVDVRRWNVLDMGSRLRSRPDLAAPIVASAGAGGDVFVIERLTGSPWVRARFASPGSGGAAGFLPAWTLRDPVLGVVAPAPPSPPVHSGRRRVPASPPVLPGRRPVPASPPEPGPDEIPIQRWNAVRALSAVSATPGGPTRYVGTVPAGTRVWVISLPPQPEWVRIYVVLPSGALEGYVREISLAQKVPRPELSTPPAPPPPDAERVAVGVWTRSRVAVAVRTEPRPDAPQSSYLQANRRVLVIERLSGSGWDRIEHHVQGTRHFGYVPTAALRPITRR